MTLLIQGDSSEFSGVWFTNHINHHLYNSKTWELLRVTLYMSLRNSISQDLFYQGLVHIIPWDLCSFSKELYELFLDKTLFRGIKILEKIFLPLLIVFHQIQKMKMLIQMNFDLYLMKKTSLMMEQLKLLYRKKKTKIGWKKNSNMKRGPIN